MLIKIEAASGQPVSIERAMAHCRAPSDDEELVEGFLAAATEFVQERVELVLAPTVFRVDRSDWWSGCISILVAPVRDIASVKYFDADGDQVTVDPALYRWTRTTTGARLELLDAFTSPVVEDDRNDAVRIEIEAGFDDPDATGAGDDPALVCPETAKLAILMLTSFWYDNRDAVNDKGAQVVPLGAQALMEQVRVFR